MRTDYIDLFLLHDPLPDDISYDDTCEFLERARDAGRIRAWGIAGDLTPSVTAATRFPRPVPVLQVPEDIFSSPLERASAVITQARVTYGVLRNALPQIVDYLTAHPERREAWSASLGLDCGDPQSVACLLLQDELERHRRTVVIFSTVSEAKIDSAVAAAGAEPYVVLPVLEAFRKLVAAEASSIRGQSEVPL